MLTTKTTSPPRSVGPQAELSADGERLQLYAERSERRRLEEEVHRLRLEHSEAHGLASSLQIALRSSRQECDSMEQLFLDQRRRNSELEGSQKKYLLLSEEAEELRSQLRSVKDQLRYFEREAFEIGLRGDDGQQTKEVSSLALQSLESEMRARQIWDWTGGFVSIISRSRSTPPQLWTPDASVGELKFLLARSEERSIEALTEVQREREANAQLRTELKVVEGRVRSLIAVDTAPSELYSPINMSLFSPTAARVSRPHDDEVELKFKVLQDDNRALRSKLEATERTIAKPRPSLDETLNEVIRKLEIELHATQQQMAQMARDLDGARSECLHHKEQAIIAHMSTPGHDALVADLGAQLREAAGALQDERKQVQRLETRLKEVAKAPITATNLDIANRKLELVISEMSEVKAQNVALKARLGMSSPRRQQFSDAVEYRNVSPKREQRSPSRPAAMSSPWSAADHALLSEVKGLSVRNARLEAALHQQRDPIALSIARNEKSIQPAPRLVEPGKATVPQGHTSQGRSLIILPSSARKSSSPTRAPSLSAITPKGQRKWATDSPVATTSAKRRRQPGETAHTHTLEGLY